MATDKTTSEEHQVVAEIRDMFDKRGGLAYGGEAVTQLEHALQAATRVEAEQAAPATITAALLHDIGHLLHDLPKDAPIRGIDDSHEQLADRWLTRHFPHEVTEPVRLHVQAKRYLCTVDPVYQQQLSEPSLVSLRLQGGLLSLAAVTDFEQHVHFTEIVRVRRCDDLAKVTDAETPDLEHFLGYVEQCVAGPRDL